MFNTIVCNLLTPSGLTIKERAADTEGKAHGFTIQFWFVAVLLLEPEQSKERKQKPELGEGGRHEDFTDQYI